MKKKDDDQDVLKQFHTNLHLLEPESFYFDKDLSEGFLQYLKSFIRSGDNYDFRFLVNEKESESDTENYFSLISKLTTNNEPTIKQNLYDCKQKYNYYIDSIIKREPVLSPLKSHLASPLFFNASQQIIFLAICDMMRPSLVKEIQNNLITQSKQKVMNFSSDSEEDQHLINLPDYQKEMKKDLLSNTSNSRRDEFNEDNHSRLTSEDDSNQNEVILNEEMNCMLDLNEKRSIIFDSLAISFFNIREALFEKISRATESVFDRWCRAICCVFFEFVSLQYEYSNLRRNSSFASKFETFIRSLINGFITDEKQAFHKGIISMLPREASSFYPPNLDTLDSLTTDILSTQTNPEVSINNYFRSKQIRESLDSALEDDSQILDSDEFTQKIQRIQKVYSPPSQSQSLNNFSMKLMLSKAVNERMKKESRVLIGVNDSSPLIKRALELRGVINIKPSKFQNNFSQSQPIPKKVSSKSTLSKTSKSINTVKSTNELTSTLSWPINSPKCQNELNSRKSTNELNDNSALQKTSCKTPKFSQTAKPIQNGNSTKQKSLKAKTQPMTLNQKRQNQVNFDFDFSEDDDFLFSTQKIHLSKMKGNKSIGEENKELLQSIRKARLAESKGFIVRERAIEQHNDIVVKSFEKEKRELYTDLCSNEAKCTEELEKFSKNQKTIMKSKVGKSLLFDKMEKEVRRKQLSKESNHLNGNKVVFEMDYDADLSQFEGIVNRDILENDFF